tara:strand:+ start:383 stop:592 length:210 start_codon:yes stop_codon:yes gene_type:complete
MSTPFINLIDGSIDLLQRAKDNINETGKDAFKYEIDNTLFTLNKMSKQYHESVERHETEPPASKLTEVK